MQAYSVKHGSEKPQVIALAGSILPSLPEELCTHSKLDFR